MASAADTYEGAAVPIKLTVAANERSNGSYNVNYSASLTLGENDVTAFAVLLAGKSKDQLEKLTFVCVLGDDMIRKQTLSAEQLANFSITDSKKIFEQVGSVTQDSKIGNNIVLTYKLNDATTSAWNLATAETVKSALSGQTVEIKQSAIENVASSAVAGTITTDAFVDYLSHFTVELHIGHIMQGLQFIAPYGIAYLEMYPALILHNSCKDTVQVLTRFLDVRLAVAALVKFKSLEYIARLPLV